MQRWRGIGCLPCTNSLDGSKDEISWLLAVRPRHWRGGLARLVPAAHARDDLQFGHWRGLIATAGRCHLRVPPSARPPYWCTPLACLLRVLSHIARCKRAIALRFRSHLSFALHFCHNNMHLPLSDHYMMQLSLYPIWIPWG